MEIIKVIHDPERYENIFNMYEVTNKNGDPYVFYNILTKVSIPKDLDSTVYEYYRIDSEIPLTTLSYRLYNTQHLWWLILATNNIKNPVKLITGGSVLKVIKKDYLDIIFNAIKEKV
jgi:hypothetical protein